ncbi:MAG: formate--phosphoribosylaminoimidazolecarboxamide ligase family protein [Crenarchaeota archaeon]|nr:formate--phosphoribosylaminoimidazolecarboxamide ligase family protein [Thermoproteota archaeon]
MTEVSIGVLGSHSALDVLDGAKDEGFRTVVVCQRGREKPYLMFPVADEVIVLDRFVDMVRDDVIERLKEFNTIFVPNRSFAVYVGYDNIENRFPIPVFGNRRLLRWEERVGEKNYYKLLDHAGIRRPKTFSRIDEVDRPVMVKIPEARRRIERGFFIARDRDDLLKKAKKLEEEGIIKMEDLEKNASIEEFILGAHFNVNYFYSPILNRLELHSIDRRIQTNLDGIIRLPADIQLELRPTMRMIEIGHIPCTIRESQLQKIFEIGEKFVKATQELEPPGIIGPFTLQILVTPDLDIVVYDVAPRIGGGTNAHMGVGAQYSKLYWRKPISMGRRIAIEIKLALEQDKLEKIVT